MNLRTHKELSITVMQITQNLAVPIKQDKASFHQLFPHLLQTIHIIGKMAAMFLELYTVQSNEKVKKKKTG